MEYLGTVKVDDIEHLVSPSGTNFVAAGDEISAIRVSAVLKSADSIDGGVGQVRLGLMSTYGVPISDLTVFQHFEMIDQMFSFNAAINFGSKPFNLYRYSSFLMPYAYFSSETLKELDVCLAIWVF